MFKSVVSLVGLFAFAAAFLFGAGTAFAEGNVHQVTIIDVKDGKLTCADGKGNQITVAVAKNARISLDGKTCKLEDLKKDHKADVTGEKIDNEKMITSIEARSK